MIKIGIIGTGAMGDYQASQLTKIKGVAIAACAEVVKESREAFCKKWRVTRSYEDYRELLKNEKLDAVSIITPDILHCEIVLAASKKGLHILCEKPLAATLDDAKKMAAAVKKSGKIAMINYSKTDGGAVVVAKKLIQSGVIGNPVQVSAFFDNGSLPDILSRDKRVGPSWRFQRNGLGALGDLSSHLFSLILTLCGEIDSLSCRLNCYDPDGSRTRQKLDANDTVLATLRLKSGAVGLVEATRWASGLPRGREELLIHCTRGSISINLTENFQGCRFIKTGDTEWTSRSVKPPMSTFMRFIAAIRTGKNDILDFPFAVKVQRCLDGCLNSDKAGASVRI